MFGAAYGSVICGLSVVDGLMIVAYCWDSFDWVIKEFFYFSQSRMLYSLVYAM